MSNGLDMNQLIRWGKKLFKLFKRAKKEYDKHQQGQQQQEGAHGGQQQQPQAWGQQQQHGASPYPQQGYGQHQQQAPGAWNQGNQHVQPGQPHGGKVSAGGYGAHDGPATVRFPSFSLSSFPLPTREAKNSFPTRLSHRHLKRRKVPLEVVEVASFRSQAAAGSQLPRQRRRLTPFSLPISPFLSLSIPTITFLPPLLPFAPIRNFNTFSPSSARPPSRPPLHFYDPSHSSTTPSPSLRPSPKPPPPPPPSALIPLTVFSLLPPRLRPSYSTILSLIGWDRLVSAYRAAGGHDGHGPDAVRHLLEQKNQDMANAQNAHYVELRNAAIREGDLMAKAFSSSKQAYATGNGEAAHDLSQEGKQHQREKDRLNGEAAEWIFQANNHNRGPGEVDLHGLYVQEAIDYTDRAISNARSQGLGELRVIVGKGNHSPSHVAKIKPAITSLMQKEHLTASLDPHNGGVLVVQLQGQGGGRSAGQFMREMEDSKDNDCVIM
ncbi:hypothetical protein JCM11251_003275 [Rhodosporidiobolus azoricus]